jgi:hypothetical protein
MFYFGKMTIRRTIEAEYERAAIAIAPAVPRALPGASET